MRLLSDLFRCISVWALLDAQIRLTLFFFLLRQSHYVSNSTNNLIKSIQEQRLRLVTDANFVSTATHADTFVMFECAYSN